MATDITRNLQENTLTLVLLEDLSIEIMWCWYCFDLDINIEELAYCCHSTKFNNQIVCAFIIVYKPA